MRPIKFRVWDSQEEAWVNHSDFTMYLDGSIMIDKPYGTIHEEKPDRFKICQFAGLLDKNGKEIYEGDIVADQNDIKYIVIWHEVEACWFYEIASKTEGYLGYYGHADIKGKSGQFAPHGSANGYIFKVIGNIYENPELLDPK